MRDKQWGVKPSRFLAGLVAGLVLGPSVAGGQDDFSRTPSRAALRLVSVRPQSDNPPVLSYGLTHRDFDAIVKSLPGLDLAVPICAVPMVARHGESEAVAVVVGTSHQFLDLERPEVSSGRFLAEDDLRRRNNVAVIGERLAKDLFGTSPAVGKNVRAGDQYFLVVGVVRENASPRRATYIPLTTMRTRFGDVDVQRRAGTVTAQQVELTEIRIKLDGADKADATRVIRNLLSASHPDQKDYAIESPRLRP